MNTDCVNCKHAHKWTDMRSKCVAYNNGICKKYNSKVEYIEKISGKEQ